MTSGKSKIQFGEALRNRVDIVLVWFHLRINSEFSEAVPYEDMLDVYICGTWTAFMKTWPRC